MSSSSLTLSITVGDRFLEKPQSSVTSGSIIESVGMTLGKDAER